MSSGGAKENFFLTSKTAAFATVIAIKKKKKKRLNGKKTGGSLLSNRLLNKLQHEEKFTFQELPPTAIYTAVNISIGRSVKLFFCFKKIKELGLRIKILHEKPRL